MEVLRDDCSGTIAFNDSGLGGVASSVREGIVGVFTGVDCGVVQRAYDVLVEISW